MNYLSMILASGSILLATACSTSINNSVQLVESGDLTGQVFFPEADTSSEESSLHLTGVSCGEGELGIAHVKSISDADQLSIVLASTKVDQDGFYRFSANDLRACTHFVCKV